MAAQIDPKSGLTFMSNLGAGAIWTGLPIADPSEPSGVKADTAPVDDPRRAWLWSPRQLLSFEGTLANINMLTAAGWECLPERTMMQAGLRIYHLWTQLREIRGLQMRGNLQLPSGPADTADDKDLWARSDDLRAVDRYPVALAFTITPYPADTSALALFEMQRLQGEPFHTWTSETLPPPTLGTRGLVWTRREQEQDEGWQRYDLDDLPPAARELQERLAEALRELATPHDWYPIGPSMQNAMNTVAQPLGYANKKAQIQRGLLATSGRAREAFKGALQDLDTAKERYERMSRAARKYPADIWLERWGEVQQMAQDLAAAYWEYHQSLLQPPVEQPPARQLPMSLNIFRDNHALMSSQINMHQIAQGLSSPTSWQAREDGRPYYHAETEKGREQGENTSTEMELRPEDMDEEALPVRAQVAQLWKLVSARSDLDGDLFLAMWAQYLSGPKDTEGYAWLTGDLFLGYRGIEPITKAEPDGDRRRAGQRTEDKQAVSAALARQMAAWVKIRTMLEGGEGSEGASNSQRKRSKARPRRHYTHESRLWLVPEVVRQHQLTGVAPDGSSSHIVAWRYKPGTWAAPFLAKPNLHFALLCQTTLQYDPKRQQWEKRLARYYMFYLRLNGGPNYGGTTIGRKIGDLLEELELPKDTTNPKRTKARFEQALARLVADSVIDTWKYDETNLELPRRNWLPAWEQWRVYVTAAPLPLLGARSSADASEDA